MIIKLQTWFMNIVFFLLQKDSLYPLGKIKPINSIRLFLIINRNVLLLSYIILFNDLDIISDTYWQ